LVSARSNPFAYLAVIEIFDDVVQFARKKDGVKGLEGSFAGLSVPDEGSRADD